MSNAANRRPLGQLLVEEGFLSEQDLAAALAEQASTGKRLGEILVSRGFLSGPALANMLADQYGGTVRTEYGIATGFRHRIIANRDGGDPVAQLPEPTSQDEPETDVDELVRRFELKLAQTSRQAMKAAETAAEKDKQLRELTSELERAQRELQELRQQLAGTPGRASAPDFDAQQYVAIAPMGDHYGMLLCHGTPPAPGTEVEMPNMPGKRFVVTPHVSRTCVHLEPI